MRRRTFTLQACSLGVVALVVLAGVVSVKAYDPEQSNSGGPTGYRGCVISNFNMADAGGEIVCDFGTQGVWAFAVADQSWHILTEQHPRWMFSCRPTGTPGAAYLVASFESGVWAWHYAGYPGTWTQLTPSVAFEGFATDDDGDGHEELQLGFTSGVWRHDFDTHSWLQYTSTIPEGGRRADMGSWGWQEGLWSFGYYQGLWSFFMAGSNQTVRLLTSSTAEWDDVVAARFDPTMPAETAIADFGAVGTWLSNSNTVAPTWGLITPSAPLALNAIHTGTIAGGLPIYDLIFADDAGRPWIWSKASGFAQMTPSTLESGFCEPYQARGLVDVSGRQQAACDFGAAGLWEYRPVGRVEAIDHFESSLDGPRGFLRGRGSGHPGRELRERRRIVDLRLRRGHPCLEVGEAHAERSRRRRGLVLITHSSQSLVATAKRPRTFHESADTATTGCRLIRSSLLLLHPVLDRRRAGLSLE